MTNETLVTLLLDGWEEVYKKGQLTLWVLLAVRDEPRHMKEIKAFITNITHEGLTVDDHSMYRALKRYEKAGMIVASIAKNDAGPDRKEYRLTPTGLTMLEMFVERNITSVFYSAHVKKLLTKEP
ncbi:PadR family transcriptional regulator [Candidatus Saccharibacteria bacterium]|nr:PadR family transcriptional regulator [Candidatus Saccharibacteria bacterium]